MKALVILVQTCAKHYRRAEKLHQTELKKFTQFHKELFVRKALHMPS